MDNPNLHIIDDGTLDTVVACAACDWEGRYNPPGGHTDGDTSERGLELARVSEALTMAADDHDCGPELDGPLN